MPLAIAQSRRTQCETWWTQGQELWLRGVASKSNNQIGYPLISILIAVKIGSPISRTQFVLMRRNNSKIVRVRNERKVAVRVVKLRTKVIEAQLKYS